MARDCHRLAAAPARWTWGEARETVDVDLTLLTGFGGEGRFIDKLLSRYEARINETSGAGDGDVRTAQTSCSCAPPRSAKPR